MNSQNPTLHYSEQELLNANTPQKVAKEPGSIFPEAEGAMTGVIDLEFLSTLLQRVSDSTLLWPQDLELISPEGAGSFEELMSAQANPPIWTFLNVHFDVAGPVKSPGTATWANTGLTEDEFRAAVAVVRSPEDVNACYALLWFFMVCTFAAGQIPLPDSKLPKAVSGDTLYVAAIPMMKGWATSTGTEIKPDAPPETHAELMVSFLYGNRVSYSTSWFPWYPFAKKTMELSKAHPKQRGLQRIVNIRPGGKACRTLMDISGRSERDIKMLKESTVGFQQAGANIPSEEVKDMIDEVYKIAKTLAPNHNQASFWYHPMCAGGFHDTLAPKAPSGFQAMIFKLNFFTDAPIDYFKSGYEVPTTLTWASMVSGVRNVMATIQGFDEATKNGQTHILNV